MRAGRLRRGKMKMTRTEIERRIKQLEESLVTVQGQPCEVYSRIVGYYRHIGNWNKGKAEEYKQRAVFQIPQEGAK